MRAATEKRLQDLEKKLQPPPKPPCFFLHVIRAGDDGHTVEPVHPDDEIRGFSAGSSYYGPAVDVLRLPGESLEALKERCRALHGVVWSPIC